MSVDVMSAWGMVWQHTPGVDERTTEFEHSQDVSQKDLQTLLGVLDQMPMLEAGCGNVVVGWFWLRGGEDDARADPVAFAKP